MLEVRLQKRFAQAQESVGFKLDVQFTAGPGVTVLFGPSGAGKSLTLDLIGGFAQPDAGRVLLNDEILLDVATNVFLPPQQRRCGYLFQRLALFPHMTLRENLAFAYSSKIASRQKACGYEVSGHGAPQTKPSKAYRVP